MLFHLDLPVEMRKLAARTTHYGYRDAATGPLSRACYRLLHRRYAGSVWARRTPFWYALGSV